MRTRSHSALLTLSLRFLFSIFLSLFLPPLAFAEQINVAGLKVEVTDVGTGAQIDIRPTSGSANLDESKIFLIESPNRLVVDLIGYKVGGSANRSISSTAIFSVRVGAHPGKLRLVFDLASGPLPALVTHSKQFPIQISLGGQGTATPLQTGPERSPTASTSSSTTTTSLTTTSSTTTTTVSTSSTTISTTTTSTTTTTQPADSSSSSEDEPKVESPLEPATTTTQPQKSVKTGSNIVRAVSYRSHGTPPTPAIAIEGQGLSAYSLKQVGGSGYEILIEGTSLRGSHLSLPQFPPDTFSSFEVVTAVDSPRGVLIRVFVEDGAKLSPFINDGTLWLKIGS